MITMYAIIIKCLIFRCHLTYIRNRIRIFRIDDQIIQIIQYALMEKLRTLNKFPQSRRNRTAVQQDCTAAMQQLWLQVIHIDFCCRQAAGQQLLTLMLDPVAIWMRQQTAVDK